MLFVWILKLIKNSKYNNKYKQINKKDKKIENEDKKLINVENNENIKLYIDLLNKNERLKKIKN